MKNNYEITNSVKSRARTDKSAPAISTLLFKNVGAVPAPTFFIKRHLLQKSAVEHDFFRIEHECKNYREQRRKHKVDTHCNDKRRNCKRSRHQRRHAKRTVQNRDKEETYRRRGNEH